VAAPARGFFILFGAPVRVEVRARVGLGKSLAILVYMDAGQQMALKDVRDQLSTVVDKVEREHDRVVITKHGRPAAVVVSVDDLESLEETVDVLSRPALLRQVRRSLDELRAGPAEALSKDDALALVKRK
jgi:antitoxin YefM